MIIKKSELYIIERKEICKKIISILDLDYNNSFLLNNLDNDENKINKIIELKEDIKKYFEVSTLSSFKPNVDCKRPHLSIIKNILKKCGYSLKKYGTIKRDKNNVLVNTMKYKLIINNFEN
jgi:hypothetical protein